MGWSDLDNALLRLICHAASPSVYSGLVRLFGRCMLMHDVAWLTWMRSSVARSACCPSIPFRSLDACCSEPPPHAPTMTREAISMASNWWEGAAGSSIVPKKKTHSAHSERLAWGSCAIAEGSAWRAGQTLAAHSCGHSKRSASLLCRRPLPAACGLLWVSTGPNAVYCALRATATHTYARTPHSSSTHAHAHSA